MGRKISTHPSEKQVEIMEFINNYRKVNGYPPSIREIGMAVGLKSSSTVHTHLEALERKGLIERAGGSNRSIRVLDETNDIENGIPENENADYNSQNDFNENPNGEIAFVPVIGKVAAGQPLLAVENRERTFPVPIDLTKGNEVFMLKVKGESMIEAGILNGDYVIVKKQTTAENGDTVVALLDDGATVKTFYKEQDYFRLQPQNRNMTAICVKEVTVLGKVIGLFRQMEE